MIDLPAVHLYTFYSILFLFSLEHVGPYSVQTTKMTYKNTFS